MFFAEFDHEAEAQAVLRQKPEEFFGFIAKGLNVSPLLAMLKQLSPIHTHRQSKPEVL